MEPAAPCFAVVMANAIERRRRGVGNAHSMRSRMALARAGKSSFLSTIVSFNLEFSGATMQQH